MLFSLFLSLSLSFSLTPPPPQRMNTAYALACVEREEMLQARRCSQLILASIPMGSDLQTLLDGASGRVCDAASVSTAGEGRLAGLGGEIEAGVGIEAGAGQGAARAVGTGGPYGGPLVDGFGTLALRQLAEPVARLTADAQQGAAGAGAEQWCSLCRLPVWSCWPPCSMLCVAMSSAASTE